MRQALQEEPFNRHSEHGEGDTEASAEMAPTRKGEDRYREKGSDPKNCTHPYITRSSSSHVETLIVLSVTVEERVEGGYGKSSPGAGDKHRIESEDGPENGFPHQRKRE